MTIERRFEPDAEALESLVEVLYRLLTEEPPEGAEAGESVAPKAPPAPCVSGGREP